jgi:hypothetical protein
VLCDASKDESVLEGHKLLISVGSPTTRQKSIAAVQAFVASRSFSPTAESSEERSRPRNRQRRGKRKSTTSVSSHSSNKDRHGATEDDGGYDGDGGGGGGDEHLECDNTYESDSHMRKCSRQERNKSRDDKLSEEYPNADWSRGTDRQGCLIDRFGGNKDWQGRDRGWGDEQDTLPGQTRCPGTGSRRNNDALDRLDPLRISDRKKPENWPSQEGSSGRGARGRVDTGDYTGIDRHVDAEAAAKSSSKAKAGSQSRTGRSSNTDPAGANHEIGMYNTQFPAKGKENSDNHSDAEEEDDDKSVNYADI